MKKLQFLPLMALVLGFGLVLSMSAFKAQKTTDIVEVWYLLTPTSNSNPSFQTINSGIVSEPTGDCDRSNDGDFCGVKLRFDNVTPPASYPSGTTVATADAAPGVSIAQESGSPVYSYELE